MYGFPSTQTELIVEREVIGTEHLYYFLIK